MRLETLQVELRPRSSWEAMELGTALVRKHAGAIWKAWLLVTLPVFALLNGAALLSGEAWLVWLAWLAMWWLRPVFDRIPLYVLSRAVFGTVPSLRETLRAQIAWGWRTMPGHLTWRRFSPMRAAMLPIDLLEGAQGPLLRERRRVLGAGIGGHAVQLTLACWHFLFAVQCSLFALGLILIPNEKLMPVMMAVWELLNKAPQGWFLLILNIADYIAVSLIEPFFVGAGFGLYLNRRTQLEAWDVEIAFRRMRKRIEAGGVAMLLALALATTLSLPLTSQARTIPEWKCPDTAKAQPSEESPAVPADDPVAAKKAAKEAAEKAAACAKQAAHADKAAAKDNEARDGKTKDNDAKDGETKDEANPPQSLEQIFGEQTVDHRAFGKAVKRAYADPQLRPKKTQTVWEPRKKKKNEPLPDVSLEWLAKIFGFLVENILWLVVGSLVLLLAVTFKHWWPWLKGMATMPEPEPPPVESQSLAVAEPLPPNIAETARKLWRDGQPRRALALMYRASVAAMTARIDAILPPGATEAECLRMSRRMPEPEDRNAFQRMVRIWQYAAYGQRLPAADEFESLLQELALRFRWAQ